MRYCKENNNRLLIITPWLITNKNMYANQEFPSRDIS